MHRLLIVTLVLLCTFALCTGRAADVAVSIRYLHPKGKSHAALFLFTSDGKLVRQLTQPTDSQDVNPAFAPDGKSLLFTSENDKTSKRALVSLNLADKAVRVIDGNPPAWYAERVIAKPFEDHDEVSSSGASDNGPQDKYTTSDGAYTIVLKPRKPTKDDPDPADEVDGFLRVGKKPELIPFAKMPGYGSFWMLHTGPGAAFPPITQPRIALLDGSHNSSDGTQFYALDLAGQRIIQLSPNGGTVFPWPGHPGFFAGCQSRYEELGDGRTVNCYYLDVYNGKLKRTRFGHTLGLFSGASVFVHGEKPLNIVDPDYLQPASNQ